MMPPKLPCFLAGRPHQNPDGVVVPAQRPDVHPPLDVLLLPAAQLLDVQPRLVDLLLALVRPGKASGKGSGKVCKGPEIISGASATTFGQVSRRVWRRQGTTSGGLVTTLAKA